MKYTLVIFTLLITLMLYLPKIAFAQPCGTYSFDINATSVPEIGCMLREVIIPNIWTFMQRIFVAVAIILTMYLIYKTVTSRDNPEELKSLPLKWMYLFIMLFLAIGLGGSLLNMIFEFLGFGSIDSYLDLLNTYLTELDNLN